MRREGKKWISSAIQAKGHPVIDAAKRHGISTHAEAEREAHSSDPTLRGRGNLALRFQKGGDLHSGGSS